MPHLLGVNSDAEAVAARILARSGTCAPIAAENLAISLGYRVHRATREEMGGLDGASQGPDLWVAKSTSRARDEWTVVHEITHQEIRRACDGQRDTEAFVDRCVGALLLPHATVRNHVLNQFHLPDLCEQFGTSYEATARRIVEVVPSCAVIATNVPGISSGRIVTSPELRPDASVVVAVARVARLALRAGEPANDICEGWTIRAWVTPGGARAVAIAVRVSP